MSKINLRINKINEKKKDIKNREKVEQKEPDSEEAFCQALSLDLKELQYYKKCIAKRELRRVLYKRQMSLMERQMRPCNFNQNQTNALSPIPSNTQTPFGIFSIRTLHYQALLHHRTHSHPTPIIVGYSILKINSKIVNNDYI